jgi:hypothetical protein
MDVAIPQHSPHCGNIFLAVEREVSAHPWINAYRDESVATCYQLGCH